jgi:hypothetical protein
VARLKTQKQNKNYAFLNRIRLYVYMYAQKLVTVVTLVTIITVVIVTTFIVIDYVKVCDGRLSTQILCWALSTVWEIFDILEHKDKGRSRSV